ncbi:hypothetical protein AOLI_G00069550 [Acnodon oligacanthus]
MDDGKQGLGRGLLWETVGEPFEGTESFESGEPHPDVGGRATGRRLPSLCGAHAASDATAAQRTRQRSAGGVRGKAEEALHAGRMRSSRVAVVLHEGGGGVSAVRKATDSVTAQRRGLASDKRP